MNRSSLRVLGMILWSAVLPAWADAAGTPAGTVITNVATVSYTQNGRQGETFSNPAALTVQEKLDLALVWLDTACLTVNPGEQQALLSYRLANTGNGREAFVLAVDNALSGDQFDPLHPQLYLDGNGNGRFDAADPPYLPTAPPELAADASLLIFVLNDIPAPLAGDSRGESRLTATAVTGSGAPGSAFPSKNTGGDVAVVGQSGGKAESVGCYLTGNSGLRLLKSAEIRDSSGGSEPRPGSVITYRIDVVVDGVEPARGLTLTDAVPGHTTYLAGTLRLLGPGINQTLTDAVDGDRGQIVMEPSGPVVQFPLGDLDPGNYTVTFQVTIL